MPFTGRELFNRAFGHLTPQISLIKKALIALAYAPDSAKYVVTEEDATLTAELVHSALTGDELHDPKTHEATHQVGGSDILYVPRTYVWFVAGPVAVGTEKVCTFRMKRATIIEDVELHVKIAPTGATLIVDINDDGTTVFNTKPEIDISGTVEDDNHVFSDTALAAGGELTMDIDQVGSTNNGTDLTVLLHCKEAVI